MGNGITERTGTTMNNTSFAWMAYRLGPARQIRNALLASARANEPSCEAEDAVVTGIRHNPSPTETKWLKQYDAARAKAKGGAA